MAKPLNGRFLGIGIRQTPDTFKQSMYPAGTGGTALALSLRKGIRSK